MDREVCCAVVVARLVVTPGNEGHSDAAGGATPEGGGVGVRVKTAAVGLALHGARSLHDTCFLSFLMSVPRTDFSRQQTRSVRHGGGGDTRHHASEPPSHLGSTLPLALARVCRGGRGLIVSRRGSSGAGGGHQSLYFAKYATDDLGQGSKWATSCAVQIALRRRTSNLAVWPEAV